MRTVPVNCHLKRRYPNSLTNPGGSSLHPSASQSTADPSSPATDVNVPHSWTVRSLGSVESVLAAIRIVAADMMSTGIVDFICSLPLQHPLRKLRSPR